MAKSRKKHPLRNQTIRVSIVLVLLVLTVFFLSRKLFQPAFIHYPAFGIDLPARYNIHGIDVSKYQQNISWEAVSRMDVNGVQIRFAFIKATEGAGLVDGCFRRNWLHAQKAGLTRGAYHFFNPLKDGTVQARNFISTVKLQPGDFPPVLDVEQSMGISTETLQKRVKDWVTTVEAAYNVKPIIYTNADFYEKKLAGKFDDYPLWVAHYFVKDQPRINRNWHFWQHSERGRVNGINAYVDFNVFNGSTAAFNRLLIN